MQANISIPVMDISPNSPIQLEGQLLIADPSLRDGYFDRSVILLTDHNHDDGAHGIVLNQPTGQTVGDLLSSEKFHDLANIPIHLGGPVGQEHLTFAAFWTDKNKQLKYATRISAADAIKRAHQPGTLIRAIAGYSGWVSGQLEDELKKQSWILTLPTSDLLASHHEHDLWSDLLRSISPYHKILAEAPSDIHLN